MGRKNLIKMGLGIILNNPSLIPKLLTLDFDNIYCSYWKLKLKKAKKMYEEFENSEKDIFSVINSINQTILNEKYSRHEAFFIPIYFMIRIKKPRIIVETGVHRGVSSLFILQALEDNNEGNLFSIDLPLAEYEVKEGIHTASNLVKEKVGICVSNNLKKRWNLILGDSKKELPNVLKDKENIDFFLHDSQHTFEHMIWEYETIWPKLIKNGLLVSDDINWNNAFQNFCDKVDCDNIKLKRDNLPSGLFGVIVKK